jgi:hypothetical protein
VSHPIDHPRCRHCGTALTTPLKGYYARRHFCGSPCDRAYTPQLRTVLCANTTCKRGEGHTRQVFTTYQQHARCCSKPCHNVDWQRRNHWGAMKARKATRPLAVTEPRQPSSGVVDLPSETIERLLEARARRRRETRSWLRIEDPWQQRSGSELHRQPLIEPYGYAVEGESL